MEEYKETMRQKYDKYGNVPNPVKPSDFEMQN